MFTALNSQLPSGKGQWFKCALHAHTTGSDGRLSPEDVCDAYVGNGYDMLLLTDHYIRTCVEDRTDLIVVTGVEIDRLVDGIDWHFVAVGPDVPLDLMDCSPKQIARVLSETAQYWHLAHPNWSNISLGDLEGLEGLSHVEVYNSYADLFEGCGYSDYLWDRLLYAGRPISAVAVDDTHKYTRELARGWVMVRAEEKTKESLLSAIRDGVFYSTTGPEIAGFAFDDVMQSFSVLSSPVRKIAFTGTALGRGSVLIAEDGQYIEHYEVHCKRMGYARATVWDEFGRAAWTNPIFVRESH